MPGVAGGVEKGAGKGSLSLPDLMKLQHELMKLNLQQEMTGKVADKAGQGVQTLSKNQQRGSAQASTWLPGAA